MKTFGKTTTIIFLALLLLAASCASADDPPDPNDEPETREFSEEEAAELEEQNEEDEIVFDDEEGSLVTDAVIPPIGSWLITYQEGEIDCPVNPPGGPVAIPASPPKTMALTYDPGSDAAFTLSDSTGELVFYAFGLGDVDVFDFAAEFDEPSVGLILYYINFNKESSGIIDGEILSAQFDCEVTRSFTGEFLFGEE